MDTLLRIEGQRKPATVGPASAAERAVHPFPALDGRAARPLYERLSRLLDYPEGDLQELCDVADEVARHCPEAGERLSPWREYLLQHPLWEAQEHYTRTFDLNPVCPLDVGYYLFGEDYQRGVFLAQLKECQEEVGMEGEVELPDHLPVVLRWLARVYATDLHLDMVADCLLPVLKKMIQTMADGSNPLRGVLEAVSLVLEQDLAECAPLPGEPR